MTLFDDRLETLASLIRQHEKVQAYQAVRARLEALPELNQLVEKMKSHQQDAVFFQKIDKKAAHQEADNRAMKLQREIEQLPLVQDYRSKLQDANDLLNYITKTIEERVNEELKNE